MIQIRPTNLTDENAINELLLYSFPEMMAGIYEQSLLKHAIPIISKSRPELLKSGTFFLASSESNNVIGCGGWTIENPTNKEINNKIGHIRHFATHPDYIRKGVARKIYKTCRIQAKEKNIEFFECFSTLNAEKFYQSLGFETIKSTSVPLTEEIMFPCLLMRQSL
jgi:N-acetylglutamate synthase-like GNAT family acetyltransferase